MPPHRTQRVELDSPRKNRFIGRVAAGSSQAEAARQENIKPSTASDLIKKWKETGTTHNRPRSGRPPKVTDQSTRLLVRNARKNRRMPLQDLGRLHEPEISSATVRRALDDCNYHRCIAKRVPLLSHRTIKLRYTWAKACRHFTNDLWSRVIWSDECYVYLSDRHLRVYVTRRPDEVYHPDCLVPTFTQSPVRVMVWGCVMQDGKGPLVVLKYPGGKGGGMNSERYRKQVLEGPFLAYWTQVNAEKGKVWFQQDGAGSHTSKATTRWLSNHSISTFPHPPTSPDLSPIEPVWGELKKQLRAVRHHPTTHEQLIETICSIWESLTLEDINKHTFTMNDRVRALLDSKGGHTRY